VYLSGTNPAGLGAIAWLDATGKRVPVISPGSTTTPRLSPDGKRLAISTAGDIFVYDLQRGVMTRVTSTAAGSRWPIWTPDGKYIAYSQGAGGIWWARADGSVQPERLLESKGTTAPQSFSPDGRRLAYFHAGEGILTLPLDTTITDHPKPSKPEPVLPAPGSFGYAAFSPDGRWLAYSSAETSGYQVYVRPYPTGAGGKWQISTVQGRFSIWSRTAKELFYETIDGHIMVAGYTVKGEEFYPRTPRRWTEPVLVSNGAFPNLDLAPDGKRFIGVSSAVENTGNTGPVHAAFLLNFFDELKRRMPVK
jgi:serine/threonine-protein kinase